MAEILRFLLGCARESLGTARGRVELVLALLSFAGWLALQSSPSPSGWQNVFMAGTVLLAALILVDVCILYPYRRIQRLELMIRELKGSPLVIEIPDCDLDIRRDQRRVCEVRILNKGPETVSSVKVELINVDELLKFRGIRLPHALIEAPMPSLFLQRLGGIDEGSEAVIHPSGCITRIGFASILVGKTVFAENQHPREDKIFCAFANTGRLIDMTDIKMGHEYRFKMKATGHGVPAIESDFLMRITNKDYPRYRVSFINCTDAPQRG